MVKDGGVLGVVFLTRTAAPDRRGVYLPSQAASVPVVPYADSAWMEWVGQSSEPSTAGAGR